MGEARAGGGRACEVGWGVTQSRASRLLGGVDIDTSAVPQTSQLHQLSAVLFFFFFFFKGFFSLRNAICMIRQWARLTLELRQTVAGDLCGHPVSYSWHYGLCM